MNSLAIKQEVCKTRQLELIIQNKLNNTVGQAYGNCKFDVDVEVRNKSTFYVYINVNYFPKTYKDADRLPIFKDDYCEFLQCDRIKELDEFYKRGYIGFIVTHMVPRDALPIDGMTVSSLSRDIYNALHYENWLGYVSAS